MKAKSLIKILISILMLALVIHMAKVEQLKEVLLKLHPTYAIAVVIGYLLGQLLSTVKWWLIAKAGGIVVPYTTALRAYFIGMFANCFGLGTLGGDFARAIMLVDGRPQKAEALASVVADRMHGLAVLSIIGSVAALIFGYESLPTALPYLPYLLVMLAVGIISAWFIGPSLVRRFFPKENKFRLRVERVVGVFPKSIGVIAQITLVSLVFHLWQITLHRIMGEAVGVTIPWRYLLLYIPFVNIVSTLPISWNGLGVRENAYVFFLVPVLLTPAQAVAFGAMWILAVTVSSAIGGLVAVLTKDFSMSSLKRIERQVEQ